MYLDAQTQFSDAQAVTASAVGTNVVDLSVDRSIGNGEPLAVVFVIDVTADKTTGDETYTFDVEYASNAAQSTGRQLLGRRVFQGGTPTAPDQDAALLVAGFQFEIVLPPTRLSESERYLGIRYTTAGTTPTVTCTTFLTPLSMVNASKNTYAKNYTAA